MDSSKRGYVREGIFWRFCFTYVGVEGQSQSLPRIRHP